MTQTWAPMRVAARRAIARIALFIALMHCCLHACADVIIQDLGSVAFGVSSSGFAINDVGIATGEATTMFGSTRAFFGDGTEIDEAALNHIRNVYENQMVTFSWQQGDVLILDNILTAHGRKPYSGPRQIVVGMGSLMENRHS